MQGNLKRLVTLLLVFVMVIGMFPTTMADDTATVPATEATVETTAPATEAPDETTVPSTETPTTELPTTEAPTEVPASVDADIMDDMMVEVDAIVGGGIDASVFVEKSQDEIWADFVELAESQVGQSRTVYEEWWGADGKDWGAMFVSYCLYNVGIAGLPYESDWAMFISILESAYENTGRQYYYPSTQRGILNKGDIVIFDTDGDGVADAGGITTVAGADLSAITVVKADGDVIVEYSDFMNIYGLVMGVVPIQSFCFDSGIMTLGSSGSSVGIVGGVISGGGGGGDWNPGDPTVYWGAPGITVQVVLHPYNEHWNRGNSYQNVVDIIETDNYKARVANLGGSGYKSNATTVYDGCITSAQTFFMDTGTGRVFEMPNYDPATKHGYINTLGVRSGTGYYNVSSIGMPNSAVCVSGPAEFKELTTNGQSNNTFPLQNGTSAYVGLSVTMPAINDVEAFFQKIFTGYAGHWDIDDVYGDSSQFAQVLRYLGCPEEYIQNYHDSLSGSLDRNSSALVPSIIWAYCTVECTNVDYDGSGFVGYLSAPKEEHPSWTRYSGDQYTAYYDYDMGASCGCTTRDRNYHTADGNYGHLASNMVYGFATYGYYRYYYRVTTMSTIIATSFYRSGAYTPDGLSEEQYWKYWGTAFSSKEAALNAFEQQNVTNAGGNTYLTCMFTFNPSPSCVFAHGIHKGGNHGTSYGNYFMGHITGAGFVNSINADGVDADNGNHYYYRGYWTPYEPVPEIKTASIKVTKSVSGGTGVDLGWKVELYKADQKTLIASGTTSTTSDYSYTFSGLEAGTYYVKEVAGQHGAHYKSDTSWHKVEITAAEQDAQKVELVTITNYYMEGAIKVVKTTDDGTGVELGWHFGLYSDKNCTKQIAEGWTKYSTTDPSVTFSGLAPGTYYVRELDDSLTKVYNSSGTLIDETTEKDRYNLNADIITVTISEQDGLDKKTVSVSHNNPLRGGWIKVQKTTNTSANLNGWEFTAYTDSACTKVAKDVAGNNIVLVTDANGYATSGLVQPGTYYIKETGGTYFGAADWTCSSSVGTVTVRAGETATATAFNNLHYGRLSLTKSTNTGADKDGWVFTVYTDAACTKVAKYKDGSNATLTTGSDGSATSGYLLPGTYYIKETGGTHAGDAWVESTAVQSVTVVAGKTTPVGSSFENVHYGKLSLTKTTNTGANKDGWQFTVYTNSACTAVATDVNGNPVVLTTNADGYAESNWVLPGTYYVKETGGSLYSSAEWTVSTESQSVKVVAGKTTAVANAFQNLHYGKLSLTKSTNTGNDKGGWVFTIYTDAACKTVAKYKDGSNATLTTGTDGVATSGYLLPGTYYVKETGGTLYGNEAWTVSTEVKSVKVVAGQTQPITSAFVNTHYGKLSLTKNTNTGNDKNDWTFTIYTDAACTTVAKYKDGTNATLTTDATGIAVSGYLLPGTYYVKETGGSRFSNPSWVVSTDVKSVTVVAGQVKEVTGGAYLNKHHGRITLQKEMATDGPLNGWNFIVYTDEACTKIATDKTGAQVTMTTDNNGYCISGYLLPGTYFVKEIIDEVNGMYYCKTRNPIPVTVVAGTDVRAQSGAKNDISFINALKPVEIEILKVDPSGNPLRGVVFKLEWFDTASNQWKTVKYSANEDVSKGYCGSAGLSADGELTTGANGLVLFENLYPNVDYRITETATVNGYVLLADSIIVEQSDIDMTSIINTDPFTRHYELTVVNHAGWELPQSGSVSLAMFAGFGMFFGVASVLLFVMYELNRKKSMVPVKRNHK